MIAPRERVERRFASGAAVLRVDRFAAQALGPMALT
jgi:hypothetical protein